MRGLNRFFKIAILYFCVCLSSFSAPENIIKVSPNCSFANAIQSANTDTAVGGCNAGSDVDTIVLEPLREYQLTEVTKILSRQFPKLGGSFYFSVNSRIILAGNNSTLIGTFQQDNSDENSNVISSDIAIFLVEEAGNLDIFNLTIKNGASIGPLVRTIGGSTPLTDRVKGAAITNLGQLTLTNVVFTENKQIRRFSPNDTFGPSAVLANHGTALINESTISNNENAGIYTNDSAKTTVKRSTIVSNTNAGIINRGHTEVFNSTITGNTGAQIDLNAGTMILSNDTIIPAMNNEQLVGDDSFLFQFAIDFGSEAEEIRLANTVLANSSNQHLCNAPLKSISNLLIDEGHNWFEDASCNSVAQGNPLLAPLAGNGGFSQTYALLADSALIDAGDDQVCLSGRDQRGEPRPRGNACDIGAFEFQTPPTGIAFQKTLDINHQWQTFFTSSCYVRTPKESGVLLYGHSPAGFQGSQPGVIRIRQMFRIDFTPCGGSTSISARFQEFTYLDQIHINEQADILAFYPGVVSQNDGTVFESGSFDLTGNNRWKTITFPQAFQVTPHVFIFGQTNNGAQPPVLRVRNVTSAGFEIAIQEEEQLMPSGHVPEAIAYLAIENPNQHGSIPINGELVDFEIRQITVNHNWTDVFDRQIKLQEEQSSDLELFHVKEQVDVLRLGSQILTQIVTFNGSDPATIRIR
jgi:hypothetical protein